MEEQSILKHLDHTLLKQQATWSEIENICKEAMNCKAASVCIPPSFVMQAAAFVKKQLPICTVIGFPNGYQTTEVKVFEAADAIKNGADEIDMVINIGWVKDGHFDKIEEEIQKVKDVCGEKILKVIIETCLLTRDEKMALCKVVSNSHAEYIKTSTGFSHDGATLEDIQLFAAQLANGTKIKAAGGIHSVRDAQAFLDAGAERLGSSSLIRLVQKDA